MPTPEKPAPDDAATSPRKPTPAAERETAAPGLPPTVEHRPNVPDLPPGLADHPRYEVLQLLGKGGMGAVYKARHRMMDRLVALKVISAAIIGHKSAVARFQREVQAAAKLHHANIVAAHDAEQAGGTHFLVMEYVEGTDLAAYVARKGPLPVAHACHFIRQAALGLQHAHEHGMVHRDIKPHNLMLTHGGVVKILDFGLARMAREEATSTGLTGENVLMGTADYIAPEQAKDAHHADIRADVYSLGCTLFHLLKGEPPFAGGSAVQKITSHLTKPPPLDDLPAAVPPELRAVVGRMTEKDPADRYPTPGEVAQALAPFLKKARPSELHLGDLQGLASGPATAATEKVPQPGRGSGKLSKTAVRPATEAATTPAAPRPETAVGTSGQTGMPARAPTMAAEDADELAPRRAKKGKRRRKGRPPAWLVPALVGAALLVVAATVGLVQWRGGRPPAVAEGGGEHDGNVTQPKTGSPTVTEPKAKPEPAAPAALPWAPRAEPIAGLKAWALRPALPPAQAIIAAVSPDERWIAAANDLDGLHLYERDSGRLVRVLNAPVKGVFGAAWSPDGKYIAAPAESTDAVPVWEAATGRLVRVLKDYGGATFCVRWNPKSDRLAVAANGKVFIQEASTGKVLHALPGHQTNHYNVIAWSPDGTQLVAAGADKTVKIWDADTGQPLATLTGPTKDLWSVAWSPDGKAVAAGADDRALRVWQAESWNERLNVPLERTVISISWSADGKRIACGTYLPSSCVILDASSGKIAHTLGTGGEAVYSVSWLAKDREIALGCNTQVPTVVAVDAETAAVKRVIAVGTSWLARGPVAWSLQGDRFWDCDSSGYLRLREAATGTVLRKLCPLYGSPPATLVPSPDGDLVALTYPGKGTVFVADVATSRVAARLENPRPDAPAPAGITWAPGGRRLAVAGPGPTVRVWEPLSAEPVAELTGHAKDVLAVAWSPDGGTLASGGADGTVRLWPARGGKPTAVFDMKAPGDVNVLSWSPDGSRLAVGHGPVVRVWDIPLKQAQPALEGHPGAVVNLGWTQRGEALVSGDNQGEVRLWNVWTAKLRRTLAEPGGKAASTVAVSPDGDTILAAGEVDVCARLWDAKTGTLRATLIDLPGELTAAVSPEGHYASTAAIEPHLLYAAATDQGFENFKPAEFAARHGWKNDPARVRPLGRAPKDAPLPPLMPMQPGEGVIDGGLNHRPAKVAGLRVWALTLRHPNLGTRAIALSPDGNRLALGRMDGIIHVRDVTTGELQRVLAGNLGEVVTLAWSPDGKRLASAGTSFLVWDVGAGRLVHDFGACYCSGLAWSPDGQTVAVGQRGALQLWDAVSGRHKSGLAVPLRVINAVAWSPDGRWVAASAGPGAWKVHGPQVVYLMDAASGEVRRAHSGTTLAWAPDGKRYAVGVDDLSLQVWDRETGKARQTFTVEDIGRLDAFGIQAGWSSDGQKLLYCGTSLRVIDLAKGAVTYSGGSGNFAVWHPDGQRIVAGSGAWSWHDLKSGKVTEVSNPELPQTYRLALSPDGRSLAVAGADAEALVWNLAEGIVATKLDHAPGIVQGLSWAPGKSPITLTSPEVRLWDPVKGAVARKDQPAGSWTPDGSKRVRYVEESKSLELFEAGADKPAQSWKMTADLLPQPLALSPDASLIALATKDDRVLLWDTAKGAVRHEYKPVARPAALAWSYDGKQLAVGAWFGNSVDIVSAESGKVRCRLDGFQGYLSDNSITWAADGNHLVCSYWGGTGEIRRWDLTGPWIRWSAQVPHLHAGTMSPDGRLMAGVNQYYQTVLWDGAGKPLGTLVRFSEGRWLTVSAEGHFRGSPEIERQLAVVAVTDAGTQETLTVAEFAKKYGWKNDPAKVKLLPAAR